MNDYLAKPFRREELLALIDHWVPPALEQTLDVGLRAWGLVVGA
jgi:DNA-binding response OmpR family regulator